MKSLFQIALSFFVVIAGCTTIISEQSVKLVDADLKFSSLREKPENYIGKHVMLGGRIAGVRNNIEGSQIEVVQFELTESYFPEDTFISYGRFLATSSEYMDSMIFQKGMLITLVGEIKGKKTLRLDDMDYVYPVVAIREFYLWKNPDFSRESDYHLQPSLYYNPYYYGYGYEPFWPRRYWPIVRPR